MPQSLSNILLHVVFSTKNHAATLDDAWRADLHAYAGGILRRLDSDLLAAGSVADHLHLLFALPRVLSAADCVREIKSGTSKWVHDVQGVGAFQWQTGYGAFSISPGHKRAVTAYIAGQAEHHRKVTFRDEYLRLLKKYDITYDERYLWE